MKSLFILVIVSISITLYAANKEPNSTQRVIENAFYGGDIDKINYKDAKMAMDIWIKKMSSKLGASSTLAFYTDFHKVKKAKKEGKVDTLILSANSYLKYLPYCKKEFSQGWMKLEKDGKPFFRYIILSRKDLQKKRKYIVEYYRYAKTAKIVAKVYAWEHDKKFLFEPVEKISKPVLNLFFRKSDYAVVKEETWELMKELNPQLSEQLFVVHQSDRIFVDIITLFSNHLSKKDKDIYLQAIEAINSTPDGKQLMELFKFNGLTKLGENQFVKMEDFYKKYLKLKAAHETK